MKNFDIYQKVNDQILKNLENAGSWQRMWNAGAEPQNLDSGHKYRGINVMLLWGEEKPLYMTFNQIKKNGLKLKKGSKSNFIVFWNISKKTVKDGDEEKVISGRPFLKYYNVFNVADIEIPEDHKLLKKIASFDVDDKDNKKIEQPEKVVSEYIEREAIKTINGSKASYSPSVDRITMPELKKFNDSESYYSVYFHEMIHSTGNNKRLDRLTDSFFGGHAYSKEELVAEMGAAYLNSACGMETEKLNKNSAAYLKSWLSTLKESDNKTFLTWAIPRAEKAAKYILNQKDETC